MERSKRDIRANDLWHSLNLSTDFSQGLVSTEDFTEPFLQSLNARSFYVKCYEQSHQVYKYHYEWRIEVYLVRRES